MVLTWRESVRIAYSASSSWPLVSLSKKQIYVEIQTEGNYDFLRDITSTSEQQFKSPYKVGLIKKYWQTLQGVSETDRLLLYLQSFSSNSVYYNIPEGIKNGVTLYYMPPNCLNPDISMQLQHNLKYTAFSQFASFWKPSTLY